MPKSNTTPLINTVNQTSGGRKQSLKFLLAGHIREWARKEWLLHLFKLIHLTPPPSSSRAPLPPTPTCGNRKQKKTFSNLCEIGNKDTKIIASGSSVRNLGNWKDHLPEICLANFPSRNQRKFGFGQVPKSTITISCLHLILLAEPNTG